ncbi:MAG: hypothetical protein HC831_15470, partial [Chloroflexia bacterium]|nr:hypothetical protein [Chloroflexia bacterium]
QIKTVDYAVCLERQKNANGTNVHLWEDHEGPWTEWYLVNPVTQQAFVPTTEKPYRIWENFTTLDKKGGVISETIKADSTVGESLKLNIAVGKEGIEAKAKLLVEAEYEITDYTDVIKYKRTTQAVNSQDFWTAYKVNFDYQIMFKDQVQEGWTIIPRGEFYSPERPKSEEVKNDDYTQKARLAKYDLLTKEK